MLKNKQRLSFVCILVLLFTIFTSFPFSINKVLATHTNLALGKTATSNVTPCSSAEDAPQGIDGVLGSHWCSLVAGVKWLTVDLGSSTSIGRWVVKHAGANGESTSYNTKDFKLQRSDDNITWTDVDTVTGNTANITDRTVTTFSSRYVRLYVTTPNSVPDATVRVNEFELYEPSGINLALGKTATSNVTPCSSAEDAPQGIDGVLGSHWCSLVAGVKWLTVDLGSSTSIGRWVVKHAGANGESTSFNTKDFKLQRSDDNITWTDVDTVTGNTANITDRTVTTFSSRYVRLYVTTPNSVPDATVRVNEFELYALDTGRNARIITTTYPTDDVVVADYVVTDALYGADNTGVNDSTAAIQHAINDAYASGGGTVWMPAGTYKVTDTIFVRAFVTLRGDWRDPDVGTGSYGTVVSANLATGSTGPTLFRIGGSAAVMGITTYYPNQSASTPVAYNYTFEIPGRAWIGQENYMVSSVINVTMLNSYRGIGISTMSSDHGGDVVHESVTIRNVKGTVLYRGAVGYNSADVGTWKHVKFSNSYWANAGPSYNAPSLSTINTWTRANGIAYTFGDLEWEQFFDIQASDYNIGINIVTGQRIQFAAEILYANIINTNIAVKVDNIDTRWGMSFLRSTLSGSTSSVQNNTAGYVKVTDSTLTGPTSGTGTITISNPGTSPTSYTETSSPKVTRSVLYDVSKAPYNAPFTSSKGTVLPSVDATTAIQTALNNAGTAGGGVVYLPAGWYKVSTRLTVPGNVELRGASSSPQRDQLGLSAGTVLFAYEGKGTTTPDTAAAFITLNGNIAGARGFRVFYPENNPDVAISAYPYTIRGNGSSVYIVNVGLTNSFYGVDLKTNRNDSHYVNRVIGGIFNKGIVIGLSTQGWVEDCLANPTSIVRVGYGISGWLTEANLFTKVIDVYTRPNEKLLIVDGASSENLLNNFAYGANIGLHVVSGTANMFNLGTDNLGTNGYGIKVDSGTVKVMNYMRYNGTTSIGTVTIYNPMNI